MAEPVKIDTHIHLYQTSEEGIAAKEAYHIFEYGTKPDVRFSRYPGTLDDVVKCMESAGYSKAVMVLLWSTVWARQQAIDDLPAGMVEGKRGEAIRNIEASLADRLKEFNLWGCELVKNHPQIVPFVSADAIALPGDAGADHLRDMVENHWARGIKLHGAAQEFDMSDQRMWPIYEACRDLGIVVVAHSGPDRGGHHYAEPQAFAGMLKGFPDLKVVIAHLGGGAWQQALGIAQAYPNAYFDLCEIIEWTGGTNAPSDQQFAQLIKDIGPERVLMGSDFPWYDLDHTVERVMELPVLSQEEKEGMLGANALRILGL